MGWIRAVWIGAILQAFAAAALGQSNSASNGGVLFKPLPSLFEQQALALGARVQQSGREATLIQGELQGSGVGPRTMRVTLQLPNLVRLDGFRPGPPLQFDGQTRGRNALVEDQLLEMFSSDTTEGMLEAVRRGAAFQCLARRVGPVPELVTATPDPQLDIFAVSMDVLSSSDPVTRLKTYAFSSDTGLLVRTTYEDTTVSPPVSIEVRFSDWVVLGDSSYSRKIERFENGRSVLTVYATSIEALPGGSVESFR